MKQAFHFRGLAEAELIVPLCFMALAARSLQLLKLAEGFQHGSIQPQFVEAEVGEFPGLVAEGA